MRSRGPVKVRDVTSEGEGEGVVMWRPLQGNDGAVARYREVRLVERTHSARKHRRAGSWQADPQAGREVTRTYKVSMAI